jgi:hypothetical protein
VSYRPYQSNCHGEPTLRRKSSPVGSPNRSEFEHTGSRDVKMIGNESRGAERRPKVGLHLDILEAPYQGTRTEPKTGFTEGGPKNRPNEKSSLHLKGVPTTVLYW